MRRALITCAILLGSGAAHAGPLGELWRMKVRECPLYLPDTPGTLAISKEPAVTLYDRATGKRVRDVKVTPKPKKSLSATRLGDTLVLQDWNVSYTGVDPKTDAVRWRRDTPTKQGEKYWLLYPAGADGVLVRVDRKPTFSLELERFHGATGRPRWTAKPPTARAQFETIVAGTRHTYLVTMDREPRGFTIVALDETGKPSWKIDDPIGDLPHFHVVGDDLVAVVSDVVRVFAGATGKVSTWKLPWSPLYIVHGDTIYAQRASAEILAFGGATGTQRWVTPIADHSGLLLPLGVSNGSLYVKDGEQLRVLDAATGKLASTYGVAGMDRLKAWDTAPAITMCDTATKTLVALDPSATATDHRVTISGRIICKNCKTPPHVTVGSVTTTADASGKFSLEVTARGRLSMVVTDDESLLAAWVRKITFDKDAKLKLGDVRVKMPVPNDLD